MLVTFALLASAPFWIDRVGLYPYLALEILIWMIFALGYNLLLGYAGLPSFGHGAFFGVGAYAFGLLQFKLGAEPVARPRRRGAGRGAGRRAGRALHLAPARHLLRAADHRLRPGVLVHRHQVAQRHRRRGRPAQHRAPAGSTSASRRVDLASQRRALLLRARRVRAGRAVACGGSCIRRSAACCRRSSRTRRAPRFVGYDVWLYKWHRVRALGGHRRAGRGAVRDGAAVGLSERDEPALLGLRRDDDADRRRPRELLGAGDRRGVLHPRARPARRATPRPGCSGSACSSWRWCCSSPRASPGSGRAAARARRQAPQASG